MSESLTVTFGSLHSGPVERSWRIESPEERLGDLPARLGPIEIELEVGGGVRDGVRATGVIRSRAECACRRCLADVSVDIDARLDAWFRPEREVVPGEDGVWAFSEGAAEIDLAPAIREELILAIPDYPICESACEGLCPGCGVRLGEEPCTCPPPEPDPRWAALTRETDGENEPGSGG